MVLVDEKALDQIPRGVVNLQILLFGWILSFSGCVHGFNTANVSGVMSMTPFTENFGFNQMESTEVSNLKGWITSCVLLGGFVGALMAAPMSDRFGPKLSLQIFSVIFIIAAILMATCSTGSGAIAQFLVGRVLSGIGSGAASVVGTAYIAEVAPKVIRGGLSALYNACTMLGISLAYWINYGALLNISSASNAQWQVPMGVQALPGVILLFGLFVFPESPRWLTSRDRLEDARASLTRLRRLSPDHPFLTGELAEISEATQQALQQNRGLDLRAFAETPNLLKRFILVCWIQVFFQFSGGNIITYYNTTILSSLGFTDPKINFLFSGIYGLVKVISVLIYCLYFVDHYGRRPLLWAGSTIVIICLTYMSIYLGASQHIEGHEAAGWVAIVAIYVYAIGYAISWATVPWIINSEVFLNSARSPCMAASITWQYLANFALTRGMPNMLISMHSYGPFVLFTCATVVGFFYSYSAFSETKGMSMEHMDRLFTVPWYMVGQYSLQIVSEEPNEVFVSHAAKKETQVEGSSQHCESISKNDV